MERSKHPRILATDLDRTLLPNGVWPADPGAIGLFNELTRVGSVVLVYVTGRNRGLAETAFAEYQLRPPDILCTDVGSRISHYRAGAWEDDADWPAFLRATSPRWAPDRVVHALSTITGLRQQEPEHCNAFKLSYYLDLNRADTITASVHERLDNGFDATLVYSVDTGREVGLLDLLPHGASKAGALEYLARKAGIDREQVVFCGDSGNDIDALTAGFSGVMVRNADSQLREAVDAARRDNPRLRVYQASGGCLGLNGYYTGGVIEGALHYGLLTAPEGRAIR